MAHERRKEDNVLESGHEQIKRLEQMIGYRFEDCNLIEMALTHRSLAVEKNETYERMEFLGDAVIGLVIAEYLFNSDKGYSEGDMSDMKSMVVSRRSLMYAGRRLCLEDFLRVDDGLSESKSVSGSLTSDAYEAIAGAIFLDADFVTARGFVLQTLSEELAAAEEDSHLSGSKSILQERLQSRGNEDPKYRIVEVTGPAHDSRFKAEVSFMGAVQGAGWGRTKKEAEKNAAKEALLAHFPPDNGEEV